MNPTTNLRSWNMSRTAELQTFFDVVRRSFKTSVTDAPVHRLADRIFNRLERSAATRFPLPKQLPVCEHLAPALHHARRQGGIAAALADALEGIASQLVWARRAASPEDDSTFQMNHANAVVVGQDGIEIRDDLWIGITLLAPETRYPDHRHPPEEIYSVLSAGEWKQNEGPWHSPGVGGVVHNPPNILHAMRSTTTPLLAIWCLWTGEPETQ
ncbi:MAG: quercetin dioxygenase-like cupin family protein [Gammaproteobacteria bacterium]|jgi:quercetin dioxygenase-like cupin family protein